MNPDIALAIDLAEIRKRRCRHGSMSQRWWQNRIYGLSFAGPRGTPALLREAIIITECVLASPLVGRSRRNNLRGYLDGLREVEAMNEKVRTVTR